jgi:hypothetical protein
MAGKTSFVICCRINLAGCILQPKPTQMKKQLANPAHAHNPAETTSKMLSSANITDTQYLKRMNEKMAQRINATQLLIEALKKKMLMQDCGFDMNG